MSKVAQIPWVSVAKAIDTFSEHFVSDPAGCLAYGRLALSVDKIQLAAVMARVCAKSGRRPEADELAAAVCERSFVLADLYLQSDQPVEQMDCHKVAFTAAEGHPSLLDQCATRIDELLREEMARENQDVSDLGLMLDFEHVRPSTLMEGFGALAGHGAHGAAARVAENLRAHAPAKLHKSLYVALRDLCLGLLAEGRDLEAAAGYFVVLRRMADDPPRLASLHRRLTRALLVQLTTTMREGRDWTKTGSLADALAVIQPDQPTALRAQGFVLAQRGEQSACMARLDAMIAASPRDCKPILLEARRCRLAGSDRAAAILYGWLKTVGHAEREAEKVIILVRRERLMHLRQAHSGSSQDVLAAAEAVLEIDPYEKGALYAGARALVRMRAYEQAQSMLATLLAADPQHVKGRQLLEPLQRA